MIDVRSGQYIKVLFTNDNRDQNQTKWQIVQDYMINSGCKLRATNLDPLFIFFIYFFFKHNNKSIIPGIESTHDWCHKNEAYTSQMIHVMHTFEIHTFLIWHA